MPALKASIVRIVDESQPGWVECRFADAFGTEHVLVQKTPVVTDQNVTHGSSFPIPVAIECVVRRTAPSESIVHVDLELPWGIESDSGLTRFAVADHQVVPCVFVSCAAVDEPAPQSLLAALRVAGCVVNHSPRQPAAGPDPRWPTWYGRGLPQAMARADAFVIVIDQTWDSSTWMGEEAHHALEVSRISQTFFWNPGVFHVRAMHSYLRTQLPQDPTAAARVLRSANSRTAA